MPDTRPVWITREQRDFCRLWQSGQVNAIADAWDAAPADATEAVRVLVQTIASLRDPWDAIDETTAAVLAALGYEENS